MMLGAVCQWQCMPRLYDCLMVTQITLKTEGPHGLPSGRQTEADPLYRGLIILTDYDCGQRFTLKRSEPWAKVNAAARDWAQWTRGLANLPLVGLPLRDYEMCTSAAGGFDWDHRHPTRQLFRKVSPAGIEPVGFRVKSDLRNH
jgi:hypothetical protein